MTHVISSTGIYSGYITIIPPIYQHFQFNYTGGVVLLVRVDELNYKSSGRHALAGMDNDSLNDMFIHLPQKK